MLKRLLWCLLQQPFFACFYFPFSTCADNLYPLAVKLAAELDVIEVDGN
jgi:hypothetical protein